MSVLSRAGEGEVLAWRLAPLGASRRFRAGFSSSLRTGLCAMDRALSHRVNRTPEASGTCGRHRGKDGDHDIFRATAAGPAPRMEQSMKP